MHGFEITRWVEARSGGALDVRDSALYQALHRLEERDLVAAEWGVTENNQRARYYRHHEGRAARDSPPKPRSGSATRKTVTDILTSTPGRHRSRDMTSEIRPGIRRLLRLVTRRTMHARRRRRDSPSSRAAHRRS